ARELAALLAHRRRRARAVAAVEQLAALCLALGPFVDRRHRLRCDPLAAPDVGVDERRIEPKARAAGRAGLALELAAHDLGAQVGPAVGADAMHSVERERLAAVGAGDVE